MSRSEVPASIGPYEILEEIGRGTTGIVYKARHRELDRVVALKVVRVDDFADLAEVDRFLRGAKAAAKLDHPGLVRVFVVGRDGDLLFAAMTLVEGDRLSDRLAKSGPMSAKEAAGLVRQLAEAVAHAHKNQVLHRNLDPDSVLFDASGRARLTGFGMARLAVRGDTLTSASDSTATGFTAPELVSASGRGGMATDVYGLGAILYAALTALPPVQAANAAILSDSVARGDIVPPSKRIRNLPRSLEAICLRCLETDPAQRYPDASAVASAIAATGIESDERRSTAPGKKYLRRTVVFALIGTIAFVAVGAGVWQSFQKNRSKEAPIEAEAPGVPLFNGSDLSGWKVVGPDVWQVENGIVRANATEGQLTFLATEKRYQDFEVHLEYKIAPTGDTGVFLRMDTEEDAALHAKGEKDFFVEVQLVGSAWQGEYRTGSMWGKLLANPEPRTNDNAWNQAQVKVVGNRVTVTINGTRCNDAEVPFRRPAGQIALQSWESQVAFRNVRLVDLSLSTPATVDDAILARVKALIEQLDAAEKALLEDASGKTGEPSWGAYAGACEAAFGTFGIDLTRPAELQADLLKQLPRALRERIFRVMDAWDVAADAAGQSDAAGRIRAITGLVDADAWRGRVRSVRANPGVAEILPLATESVKGAMSAEGYDLLALILVARKLTGRPEALTYFRAAQKLHPKNFWQNFGHGLSMAEAAKNLTGEARASQLDLAMMSFLAAKASRPEARVIDGPLASLVQQNGSPETDLKLVHWILERGGRATVRPVGQSFDWQDLPVQQESDLPRNPIRVIGMSLSGRPVGDGELVSLAKVPFLQEAYLDDTKLTDDGIQALLRKWPSINCLNLEGTSVTDGLIENLRGLKAVYLRRTAITDMAAIKLAAEGEGPYVLHKAVTETKPRQVVSAHSPNGHALRLTWDSWVELPISMNLHKPVTIEAVILLPPELELGAAIPLAVQDSSNRLSAGYSSWARALIAFGGAIDKGFKLIRSPSFAIDRPTHVAIVVDGDVMKCFVDGKSVGAANQVRFPQAERVPCMINHPLESKDRFVGLIREVRFSSIARYSKDFTPVDRHEPDEHTVGLYHLDEGKGDVARDSSGKNNHGKIVNARWVSGPGKK
ncbi:MAG: family 16 glycoside hydrolase [Gemmataceae bacterium]